MRDFCAVFSEKIDRDGPGGCWLWTAFIDRDGYGQFWVNGKHELAHRIAWTLSYGLIPEGMCTLHQCDVPSCVNPEHLFLGTQADNMRDMRVKGRSALGEKHGNSKLTRDLVKVIRTQFATGEWTQQELAKVFGVSQGHISHIVRRDWWR